jgi:hypothetical protein
MREAKGHGKAFLQSTIGQHPVGAGIVMAALIVLVLILGFFVVHYKDKCKPTGEGFITPMNNLVTGSNNPIWQLGSMDAGNWGPIHREATATNVAAWNPGWRTGAYRRASREGMHVGGGSPCGPGEVPVTYTEGDGTTVTYCRSMSAMPGPPSVCGASWDPAAQAEAEALATVGGLQPDAVYGERRLQRAIGGAFDSSLGLSDDQLTTLMHQGGTP